MQITSRASVLVVALFASAPLLAAGSGTSTAGADTSTNDTLATTQQENCTLPALPPMNLSPDKLAGLLSKPGSLPLDPAEVDRRLREVEGCAHALGLRAPDEGATSASAADSTSSRTTIRQRSSTSL